MHTDVVKLQRTETETEAAAVVAVVLENQTAYPKTRSTTKTLQAQQNQENF